jgi:hypothetical protein
MSSAMNVRVLTVMRVLALFCAVAAFFELVSKKQFCVRVSGAANGSVHPPNLQTSGPSMHTSTRRDHASFLVVSLDRRIVADTHVHCARFHPLYCDTARLFK